MQAGVARLADSLQSLLQHLPAGTSAITITGEEPCRSMLARYVSPGSLQESDTSSAWACEITACGLTLSKKTRFSLLGSLWVQRIGTVSLALVPAESSTGQAPVDSVITTEFRGWFHSADLVRYNREQFAGLPVPPASDVASRWVAPLGITAALGVLTYLFFSVR